MIVVAIISILAAIALPAYQTYAKRAHVAEGLSLSNDAKVAIADYYASFGTYPANNSSAGISSAASIKGNAIRSIAVNTSQITITYNTKVESNKTIILQGAFARSSIEWTCTGGTISTQYRPLSCR